jgi:Protein of unknown function (DUF1573)
MLNFVYLILFLASTSQPSPLRFSPDPLDFGTIVHQPTEDPRLDVRLTNTSGAPIHIARIDTSCKCTSADFAQPRTLAPNESISVPIYLNKSRLHVGDERMTLSVIDDRGATIASESVTYRFEGPATRPQGGE